MSSGELYDVAAEGLGPPPPIALIRLAQLGCIATAALMVAVATGVLGLGRVDGDAGGLSVSGRRVLDWNDRPLAGGALLAIVAVVAVSGIAVFASAMYVHRWIRPHRSTTVFALISVCCIGGVTVPWVIGRAAWPGRLRRFVPLVASVLSTGVGGSVGPAKVNVDVWPWWRGSLVGGMGFIAVVSLAFAFHRIAERRRG